MSTTPILILTELESTGTNNYAAVNQLFRDLESSVQGQLEVDLSSGNGTVTNSSPDYEMLRYGVFKAVDNTVSRSITFSANQRVFQVWNSGSASLDVTIGSTTIAVPSGDMYRFYCDGTTNSLVQVE